MFRIISWENLFTLYLHRAETGYLSKTYSFSFHSYSMMRSRRLRIQNQLNSP